MIERFYPVGTPGRPWDDDDREQWRARQPRRRSYFEDVLKRVEALDPSLDKVEYGSITYGEDRYPLVAARSRQSDPTLPSLLVTGGVHGYETSGIAGALAFLEREAANYAGRANLLVAPCVSPWGYERINRWTFDAVDPNRNFRVGGPSPEACALIALVDAFPHPFTLHIDLHETTDSDADEFTPALAARDGQPFVRDEIPDGFYLVADEKNPQLDFQRAIIDAVAKVVPIAPPSSAGEIIGLPVIAPGIIAMPVGDSALCTSISAAPFTTTTEVYPDGAGATPELCVEAQLTAVRAAIDYVLSSGEQLQRN